MSQLALLAQGGTVTLTSERKEITLDPKVLARYVGAYRMAAGGDMLITLDGSQLSGQLTGQGALPIFPQSETTFFLKVVNAEIEFPATPADGPPEKLVARFREKPLDFLDPPARGARQAEGGGPGQEVSSRRPSCLGQDDHFSCLDPYRGHSKLHWLPRLSGSGTVRYHPR